MRRHSKSDVMALCIEVASSSSAGVGLKNIYGVIKESRIYLSKDRGTGNRQHPFME